MVNVNATRLLLDAVEYYGDASMEALGVDEVRQACTDLAEQFREAPVVEHLFDSSFTYWGDRDYEIYLSPMGDDGIEFGGALYSLSDAEHLAVRLLAAVRYAREQAGE